MVMTMEQQVLNLGLVGVSCACAQSTVQPCETAMVRQQLLKSGTKTNLVSALTGIVQAEGVRGLYRGIEAALLREMSYSALRFGLYEPIRDAMDDTHAANARVAGEDWAGTVRFAKRAFAGSVAGGIASAIASPTDLLKIRAQSDLTQPIPGIAHFVRKIAAQPGGPIKPFYEGVSATISRAVVLGATKMVTYNEVKDALKKSPGAPDPAKRPAAWQRIVPGSCGWSEVQDWKVFGHAGPPSTAGQLGLVFITSFAAGLAITITTSPLTNARTHMMANPGVHKGLIPALYYVGKEYVVFGTQATRALLARSSHAARRPLDPFLENLRLILLSSPSLTTPCRLFGVASVVTPGTDRGATFGASRRSGRASAHSHWCSSSAGSSCASSRAFRGSETLGAGFWAEVWSLQERGPLGGLN